MCIFQDGMQTMTGMNVWSVWIYKTLNSLIDWSKGKNADLSDFEGKRGTQ